MVKVFIQEKVGSKLAWAIRKVISVGAEWRDRLWRVTIHMEAWDGKCQAIVAVWRWNRQNVPKRRHTKFRRRGITQKKTYNIHNTAKVWNQDKK
jgi:hypothetical protein